MTLRNAGSWIWDFATYKKHWYCICICVVAPNWSANVSMIKFSLMSAFFNVVLFTLRARLISTSGHVSPIIRLGYRDRNFFPTAWYTSFFGVKREKDRDERCWVVIANTTVGLRRIRGKVSIGERDTRKGIDGDGGYTERYIRNYIEHHLNKWQ